MSGFWRLVAHCGGPHLEFKDSILFLKDPKGSSLSTLVEDLADDDLNILKTAFPNDYTLLKRKGVFPYDWFNSKEKLLFTKIPDQSDFKNKLTGVDLSNRNYKYAKYIWKHFKLTTF